MMYDITKITRSIESKGFYLGNIETDLLNDINRSEFYEMRRQALADSQDTDNLWYMNCIHGHIGNSYPNVIAFNEISERRQLIKEKNFEVDQQWHWFGNWNLRFWEELVTPMLKDIYTDLVEGPLRFDSRFSLYKTGDFTRNHIDTQTKDRYCVVLIYLTDAAEYNDGSGELILYESKDSVEKTVIVPLFPNYVILDIHTHGVFHEVLEVKNNFSRLAFLSFIHKGVLLV